MSLRTRYSLATLAVLSLIGLSGCVPHYVYFYRLTLKFTDGAKIYSGSSVVRVETWMEHNLGLAPSFVQVTHRGGAPVILVGPRAALVATFHIQPQGDSEWRVGIPTDMIVGRLGEEFDFQGDRSETLEGLGRQRSAFSLNTRQLPFMVTLSDRLNPNSLRQVDPKAPIDLAGKKLRFVSAVVQLTSGPESESNERIFPWLAKLSSLWKPQLCGGVEAWAAADCVNAADF